MGCTCSQDTDGGGGHRNVVVVHDDANLDDELGGGGRRRRRHRNLSAHDNQIVVSNAAALQRQRRNTAAASSGSGGEGSLSTNADIRRQAQEDADFALAQVLFQEQLAFMDRQRRLEQERDARPPASPTLPGLRAEEFDTVGRVMRFDVATTKAGNHQGSDGDSDGDAAAAIGRGCSLSDANKKTAAATAPDDGNVFFATESMECALCMEDLELGCELRLLFCGHAFHKTCVDEWLQRKRVCPMCQQDVTVAPPLPPVLAPPAHHCGGWTSATDRTTSDDDDDESAGYVYEQVDQHDAAGDAEVTDHEHGALPVAVSTPLRRGPPPSSFDADRAASAQQQQQQQQHVVIPESPIVAGAGACGASVSMAPPCLDAAATAPPRSTTPVQIGRPPRGSAAVAVSISEVLLTTASTNGPLEPVLPGHASSPLVPHGSSAAEPESEGPRRESQSDDTAVSPPGISQRTSSINPFNQAPPDSPSSAPGPVIAAPSASGSAEADACEMCSDDAH